MLGTWFGQDWRVYGVPKEIGVDINITAIERNLRLYALPGAMVVIGVVGSLLVDPNPAHTGTVVDMLEPAKRYVSLAFALVALAGALWGGYRAWLEWRWEQGMSSGGCLNCGGDMQQFEGRYGNYSKCLMCGSKRKGHH